MISQIIIDNAIKSANDVTMCRYRHGATIFKKNNNIISSGFNKLRFNGFLSKYGYKLCLLHAESDAILKCKRHELKNSSLLVIRLGKNGKLCNSKPCEHCMAMILEVGIKHVYHSTSSGEIVKLF